MRKFLEYAVIEGKTFLSGPELTRRFSDIDGRLHVLEELKVGWEAAVLQVQNHGLERINNVLQPILDQARAEIDAVHATLVEILATWQGDHAAILTGWQTVQDGWAVLAGDFAALQAQAIDHEARLTALADQVADLDLQPRALDGLLEDEQDPAENDVNLGAVRFPAGGAVAWGHFAAWREGAAWRVQLEVMMSAAEATGVGLALWWQAFGPHEQVNLVKLRWRAGTAYVLDQERIPNTPNGHRYRVIVAGTSGAAEPAWPTASGATVVDGGVTWQCLGPGLVATDPETIIPPDAALERFDLDSPGLAIPVGVAAGDRVYFALVRRGDAHSGDLIVNELRIAPVEV